MLLAVLETWTHTNSWETNDFLGDVLSTRWKSSIALICLTGAGSVPGSAWSQTYDPKTGAPFRTTSLLIKFNLKCKEYIFSFFKKQHGIFRIYMTVDVRQWGLVTFQVHKEDSNIKKGKKQVDSYRGQRRICWEGNGRRDCWDSSAGRGHYAD